MSRPAHLSKALLRANLVGACLSALATLFIGSTYRLCTPHCVGHLIPIVGVFVAAGWTLLYILLARTQSISARVALLPASLTLVAIIAIALRYWSEASAGIIYPG